MGLIPTFEKYQKCGSPDPLTYASYIASCAITDFAKSVSFLMAKYPAKTCGALSISGSASLLYHGIESQNALMIGCSMMYLASDNILFQYADPVCTENQTDPQDKEFTLKDLFDYKKYPSESSTALEGMSGYTMLLMGIPQDGTGAEAGYMINGGFDTVANGLTLLIREQKSIPETYGYRILNLPGIKNIADLIVTRPNAASSTLSLTGLAGLGLYELAHNNWSMGNADLPILIFSGANILAEASFMFSQKRAKIASPDSSTNPNLEI